MKRKKLITILQTLFILCLTFINLNLYSQNIISRDSIDYIGGSVPATPVPCADYEDLNDLACIINLAPAQDGYSFQIPLVNEPDRPNITFVFIPSMGCNSGSISCSADGTITMPTICQPDDGTNFIDFNIQVIHNLNGTFDHQRYRIPILRAPVKVVLVLDISSSMGQVVTGGIDTSWNVLKNSVNQFTAEFEKYYQEGDSISVIYYSKDTVMPDEPIGSNFIAITPEDFTPSNLKSSEIINADMLNRTLQDSAAMGNALLLAKSKLQNADATKIVFLFTDGYQDVDPLIHEYLGNKLYNGEFLNDYPCDAIDSIPYYTVGMGTFGSIPIVLENISLASAARNLYTTTGSYISLQYFFDDYFYDMIKGIREPISTRIIDLSPFDDSINVPVNSNLTFSSNKILNANTGYIKIKRSLDDSDFEIIDVTSGLVTGSGTSTITINPANNLESNTDYYILIDDTAFNVTGISSKTFWNFVTEDILSPNVSISTLENNPTNSSPFEITIEFNEEISGFDIGEINVINGTVSNLNTSNDTIFTADITPTTDGLITINIDSAVVVDNAGNPNTESNTFEINFDSTTPSVSISTTENSPTNSNPFEITIEFSEEITGFDEGDITLVNGAASNLNTSNDTIFTADITPTEDGIVTVNIESGVTVDNAGNPNTESNILEINFDSTGPSVLISTIENNPTNSNPFEITIEFSEEISGFDVGDISIVNGTASNLNNLNDTIFTADINPTADGLITININSGVAIDTLGNSNIESNILEINFDYTGPSVLISTTENSPTNSNPFEITIEFSEEITGFEIGDISVINGTASNLSTSDSTTFTANVTPTADGLITININSGVTFDNAGNPNTESNTFEINFDSTGPSVLISTIENNPTNSNPFEILIEFSEKITGFDVGDISVVNGTTSILYTSYDTIFTTDITPTTDGLITININSGVAYDNLGNSNTESNIFEIDYDSTRPFVSLSADNDSTTNAQFNTYVNFSERIIGFNASEINIINGNINSLATSDSIDYVATITAITQGEIDININENQVSDSAGNMNTAADELTVTYYVPTNIEVLKKDGISIYSNNGFVIVEFLNPHTLNFQSGYIEIYSLNGSLIKKENIERNSLFKTYVNDQREIYLVKLTLDKNIYYAKIQN
ncbi:MAG: hypothetical protein KAT68_19070 [Bacteroidales bacterium]|nr:hypothetical protein [Bacteroidales bacterium]